MEIRRNNGSIVAGSILVIVGLLVLLGQLFREFNIVWDTFWPFIIIGVGLLFFAGMLTGGKPAAGLAIPGSIITTVGLILFVQNLTDYWQSWSYAWTVILIAVGLGLFIRGTYAGDEASRKSGIRVMGAGFVLLLIFGAFFELVLNSGRLIQGDVARFGLPVLLIAIGVVLLLRRLISWPAETPDESGRKPSAED